MKNMIQVAGVVTCIAVVLGAAAAFAGTTAPELDPGTSIAGLTLLGGAAVFVIERYRRRTK
jgi:hypothetical protein